MQKSERESSDNVEAIVFVETDCAFVRADDEVELDCLETSLAGLVATFGRNNNRYAESTLATASGDVRPKGYHGNGGPEGRAASKESGEMVTHAPCSPALRTRVASKSDDLNLSKNLRAALERLKGGING